MRTDGTAYAAVARSTVPVFSGLGGPPRVEFPHFNENRAVTVFGVLASCGGWLRVQLPMRPNGSVGWIRERDVELQLVRTRITVRLGDKQLVVMRQGRELFRAPVAVGTGGTPTPTGHFYVNQRLLAADPGGPYGPGAVGISAFSPTLRDWPQGGPIAIHGTNDPGTIGQAASHGCVRVHNAVLRRLMNVAVPGTPVVIAA
jgi:hypothetical protein